MPTIVVAPLLRDKPDLRARATRSTLQCVRYNGSMAAIMVLAGCDPPSPPDIVTNAGAPIVATSEPGASRSAELPDAMTLAELIEHVPSARARKPTVPDGGTLVGSDSGVDGEELPEPPPVASRPKLRVGRPQFRPLLSNPAIERAARAQIYWQLRKCTTETGAPPPAESIVLSFTLRPDGTVDPATVGAEALDDSLDGVAECVVRMFSTVPFRGPAAAHGTSPRVVVVWPSVD